MWYRMLDSPDPEACETRWRPTAQQKAMRWLTASSSRFPMHRFNLTSMLNAHRLEVWTYGWVFGPQGNALPAPRRWRWHVVRRNRTHAFAPGPSANPDQEALTPMKIGALSVGTNYLRLLGFPSLKRGALGSRRGCSPRQRKPPDARQALPHALSSAADTDRP